MVAPQVAMGGTLVTTQPLSTTPSQSLSLPSPQISLTGPTEPAHRAHAPAVQVCVPVLHSPTSVPHTCVSPSSTMPSQSSSLLLHTSVPGPTEPTHGPSMPWSQVCVPATHSPVSMPQATGGAA